ncbi:hypothetical protein P154DRAFT_540053 [Amniculicola lignicola CBS 123094]|uniref:AA1-like domain-containing protein n=1 Tax=Amniculicola lignicola CBS 123094 TaxID=1392246 RepID=A0A6A5VYZ6_9PLEO|nr:hypothetical protein P154DRAFT_540053 [Amniculicola lignicola CBS 123094]
MLRSTTLSLLFAALALASPLATPIEVEPRQTAPLPTLYVSEFYAFMADNTVEGAQSNLSFRVTDLRSDHFSSAICEIPNTYFHLYAISALFDYCGERENGWMYSFNEGGLTVRKGWYEG